MTAEQRLEYDKRLIAEGYLLPSRQGRPAVDDDVFADVALDLLKDIVAKQAEPSSPASGEPARLAAEMASDAEQEQAAAKPPKKSRAGAKRNKS